MNTAQSTEREIAASLLKIGAVALRPHEPFTWTSGIKSPIYCDNRLTMSHPEIRDAIAEAFAAKIRSEYSQAEVVAGTATAGIPHAAWVAQKLGLPMIYVRDKAKGHGKQNQIEGALAAGQKVIVIEDLISTGGSSLKAALAVNEAGGQALGVLAIFSYQLDKGIQAFAEAGIPLDTLTNYSRLLEVAVEQGAIAQNDLELLRSWRQDPASYGV
ncbi:orotate phosphoribosyltransferase [Paenibacillus chitinolyticus]|uniref:orotate phosphoribosyltransferase n=1 Tax=Paenibacillus chitinolyticus TaxID=79263 RepID=UPI00366CDDCA